MEMYKVKLTMGDWSKDGHGQSDCYHYLSNYPVEAIRQGYKDSCKKTGLSFNHNEDYTERNLDYRSWRRIWTKYEEREISEEAIEILKEYGLDISEYSEDNCISIEDAAALIMNFIALSMPADWTRTIAKNEYEPINGWWNKDLNVQFGYGLY